MSQLHLFDNLPFDKPLSGLGAVRTWSGSICATVASLAMGWTEQGTGGAGKGDCVPDAWMLSDERIPVEIKAVSLRMLNGKSVIYKFRMEKEQKAYPNLRYAFVGHAPLGKPSTLDELHRTLSNGLIHVTVVLATEVHAFAEGTGSLRIPKTYGTDKRIGYNREGYSEGYYNVTVGQWFRNKLVRDEVIVTHEGRRFKVRSYRHD